MKKSKIAALIACFCIIPILLVSCSARSTLLGEAAVPEKLSYEEINSENYRNINTDAKNFATLFTETAYLSYDKKDNFAVSPIAVYAALALAARCAEGDTRAQLLSVIGESAQSDFSLLYRFLQKDTKTGKLQLANSIWLQENVPFSRECIDSLSNDYFCYSYAADFANDNASANRAVRKFVKDKTRGLIDQDYRLSPETIFTIVTALYLKDTWFDDGDSLDFTREKYAFEGTDGTTQTRLLEGMYKGGRAYVGDGFTSFFTQTHNGYKIKFILPDKGKSIDEVFNAKTLAEVNSLTDYGATDDSIRTHYHTRCLFPEFDASYDADIRGVLGSLGITSLFSADCDLSALLDGTGYENGTFCSEVRHTVKLSVDDRGIEGAAVVVLPAAGAAGPDGYENVYYDFVLDRSFGFIVTDTKDLPLFTGVVKNV